MGLESFFYLIIVAYYYYYLNIYLFILTE